MPTRSPDLDPDVLLETARVLARAIPVNSFEGVRASLEYLHHSDQDVTPDALRAIVPCDLAATDAEDIVFQLAVEGILGDEALDPLALRTIFAGARVIAAEDDLPENTVVATIPYEDTALSPSMFEPLHGSMLELIRSAADELVLMSPFLSQRAYERLRPALHTATDNGADITLITRYLTYGSEDYNREFTSAVLGDERLKSQSTVYEYVDDETWTTFHAKIVIADGVRAYLGTANLTHRGLGDNLELGVIFRDETANRLSSLVEMVMGSSFLRLIEEDDSVFSRV